MTRVNFNFTKDVCYLGANKLKESFLSETPFGIKEIFKEAKTIYPYISKLPDKMKKAGMNLTIIIQTTVLILFIK